VMRAVRHHTQARWILLYVERWLQAPVQHENGNLEARTKGSPQGAVISPLLSNLFMHYAFDEWLRRHYPSIQFARYADDAIIHAASLAQAQQVLGAVRERLRQGGLELPPEQTRIVYCKDADRTGTHDHITFDFLGYTCAPRRAKNRWGKYFVSFLPAVSKKAAHSLRATMRSWRLGATRNTQSLEAMARVVNPYVRGWVQYYGRFYQSALTPVLRCLERALVYWARRKYKRLRRHRRRAEHWLGRIARRAPPLFVLWHIGIRPATGQ
jgi:RNA-directed DNA polymerase